MTEAGRVEAPSAERVVLVGGPEDGREQTVTTTAGMWWVYRVPRRPDLDFFRYEVTDPFVSSEQLAGVYEGRFVDHGLSRDDTGRVRLFWAGWR